MLQEIFCNDVASYRSPGQTLGNLKAINFIFGTNASGKTTISRIISNPSDHPASYVKWQTGRALECLVYNCDFTKKSYAAQLQGIFTLGEQADETLKKISEAKTKIDDLTSTRGSLIVTLGSLADNTGKQGELRTLRQGFEEQCWVLKTAYDQEFQQAFQGLRNSKEKFCDRLLSEASSNRAELFNIETLKKRAETVFEEGIERQIPIERPDFSTLLALEAEPILIKKVIGKEDIDIAALIKRLGNSDWVRQGLTYVSAAGEPCPFCQQDIDDSIHRKLTTYFDETFLQDIAAIEKIYTSYQLYAATLLRRLEEILAADQRYLNATHLRAQVESLTAKIALNQQLLERKRREPSTPVMLESLHESIGIIGAMIDTANASIKEHNAMVANLGGEKAALISQVWRYLTNNSQEILTKYDTDKSNIEKAINGLSGAIQKHDAELNSLRITLNGLEKSITSVEPTVIAINNILQAYGFNSFRLATTGEKKEFYEIIRGDGRNASTTLSEGEKTFITFLYFYHLIRGSASESGITQNRVVVFDDPVSSLDSDLLFIVSSLIRRLLEEACMGQGRVKQVFVLTHNIYFHKEVAFDPKRSTKCRSHETFWIVRKIGDQSVITTYDYNPIKTSYELMWAEVKNADRSNLTIQNTLRRILENYFKILGNLDFDQIIAKFEGKDQHICRSLFSWVHDGSHSVYDDLYISTDAQSVERFLLVFKQIFEKTNHVSHYAMMMGLEIPAPGHASTSTNAVTAVPNAA